MKKFKSLALLLVFSILFASSIVTVPVKAAPAPKVTGISITKFVIATDGYGYATLHINGQQKSSALYCNSSRMTLDSEQLYSVNGIATSRDQIFKTNSRCTSSGNYEIEATVVSVNNGGVFTASRNYYINL